MSKIDMRDDIPVLLTNMGTCQSSSNPNPILYATFPTYGAAGVLFTDLVTVLAATQRHRAVPVLSGLGGKREVADADWFDTAWRETAEELFGWSTLPDGLLRAFRAHLQADTVTENSGYVIVQCSFETLHQFLQMCAAGGPSPYYKQMPRTLMELILERDPSAKGEIGGLALLPVRPNPCLVDRLFQGDLKRLVTRPLCEHPPPSDATPSQAPCSSA